VTQKPYAWRSVYGSVEIEPRTLAIAVVIFATCGKGAGFCLPDYADDRADTYVPD